MDTKAPDVLRVVDRALHLGSDDVDPVEADSVVSGSIYTYFRQKLGPQSILFLDFYQGLYAISEGAPIPEDGLVTPLRGITRVLSRLVTQHLGDMEAPRVVNGIFDQIHDIMPFLRRIESGTLTPVLFKRVSTALVTVVQSIGQALGRPLSHRPHSGLARWPILRLMTKDQEQTERLRQKNPDLYADISRNRQEIQRREQLNLENIERAGLIPLKQRILGKMVTVGEDPATKERFVYTLTGDVLSVESYTAQARATDSKAKQSAKVFPNGLPTKDRPKLSLEGVRSLTDAQLADPSIIPEGQTVSYAAMTDDKTVDAGTRIYPTKIDSRGRPVVISGRFKGVYLDDVVNRAGRLLEGTVYDFDKQGKRVPFLSKKADGTPSINAFKEPYVTVGADGRFLIKLPFLQGSDWTTSRHRIRKLSGFIPTVKYEEGTDNTTYTFEEKDFSAVRSAVGGMCLSKAAADKLEAYFTQVAKQEAALNEDSLKSYGLDRIGGFKVAQVMDPATGAPYLPSRINPDLFDKQKQALSWVESQGYKGVVALDTGIGKTRTVIASMMKMIRDGIAGEGTRFLYVCPTNLKGNMVKEIKGILQNPQDLLDRLDIVSYAEFRNRRMGGGKFTADPTYGMNPPYAAVYFDEAQELVKNEAGANSLAAQGLNHPRKILLTASPMEDDPDQLYVGIAIANNINLAPGKRGQPMSQARKDLLRFRERFCLRVGGRTMGLKKSNDKDPTVEEDFKTWAKKGMFFAHKKDVIEKPLPALRKSVQTLTMDPKVEVAYKASAATVAKIFRALVSVYRDKENIGSAELRSQVGSFQMKLAKQLGFLSRLSNMPETLKAADGTPLFPGVTSPKVAAASDILNDRLGNGSRALLFTDDPTFAEVTARSLSSKFPVMLHAVALTSSVIVYQNGTVSAKYGKKLYKAPDGSMVPEAQWATHVLTNIIQANPQVVSLVLTKTFSVGQNLQSFDTVIHLDRDTFSSEMIKQRTARAWRTGQRNVVDEFTLDAVYSNPVDDKDATLDEIRKYIQVMQEDVFDEIVGQSQAAAIGTEWAEMGQVDASFLSVNRTLLEVTLAPYVGHVAEQEYSHAEQEAMLAMDPAYHDWITERTDEAIEHQVTSLGDDYPEMTL